MSFAVPGRHLLNAVASGSTGNTEKCCWPSRVAAPPRWVGIAIAAPAADRPPGSPTTRAETGIAHGARATRAYAGSRRGERKLLAPAMCMQFSPCCRGNWPRSPCRTSGWFTTCSSMPAPRPCLRSLRDHRHLGAEIGFFSVLHSWNQRLEFHPHVHCVIAAGGLAPDHASWISARRSFFLPIGVLSRVFRGKFVAGLRNAFHRGDLKFHPAHMLPLAEPRFFRAWLRALFRQEWIVYAKPPFGGPEHVLRYLGAAPTLIASRSQLQADRSGRWQGHLPLEDSAHGNEKEAHDSGNR